MEKKISSVSSNVLLTYIRYTRNYCATRKVEHYYVIELEIYTRIIISFDSDLQLSTFLEWVHVPLSTLKYWSNTIEENSSNMPAVIPANTFQAFWNYLRFYQTGGKSECSIMVGIVQVECYIKLSLATKDI